jgi:hypothetical protein
MFISESTVTGITRHTYNFCAGAHSKMVSSSSDHSASSVYSASVSPKSLSRSLLLPILVLCWCLWSGVCSGNSISLPVHRRTQLSSLLLSVKSVTRQLIRGTEGVNNMATSANLQSLIPLSALPKRKVGILLLNLGGPETVDVSFVETSTQRTCNQLYVEIVIL